MSGSVNKLLVLNARDRNMELKAVKRWYNALPWNKRAAAKENIKEFHRATKAYKGQK